MTKNYSTMRIIGIFFSFLGFFSCRPKPEPKYQNNYYAPTSSTPDLKTNKLSIKKIEKDSLIPNIAIKLDANFEFEAETFDSTKNYQDYWALIQISDSTAKLMKVKARWQMFDEIIEASKFYCTQDSIRYLFSDFDFKKDTIIRGKTSDMFPLMPNDRIDVVLPNGKTSVYASGDIEEYFNDRGYTKSKIIDFKIHISNTDTTRIFYANKFIKQVGQGQYYDCYGIDWIGDIDFDNEVDMILNYSNHHCCVQYRLYLSSLKRIDNHEDYVADDVVGN